MRSKYRRGLDMVDKLRRGYMNIGLLLLVLATIVLVPGASANQGYASQTGKLCGYCHIDPSGGGILTAAGDIFIDNGYKIPVAALAPKALSIIAPANIAVEATGILTNVADLGVPTITGGTQPYTTINDAPLGGNFAVGETIVTWTVNDSVNAVATAIQTVTVTDPEVVPPEPTIPGQLTIIAPANIAVEATGILTNVADLGVPTITGGTPPYTTINDAPLGGNFAVGETIVTWTVSDSVSAVATAIQTVTVTDPEVLPPMPPLPTTGGVLSGKVFNDLNKDEDLSAGDIGLAGMPVKLTGTGESTKGITIRTSTDADGNYQFPNLQPGRYCIHSKFKSGWVSTTRVTFVVLDLQDGQTVVANFGKTENVHAQEGGNSAIVESVQTENADVQKVAETVTTNSGEKKNKHTEEVAKTVTTNSGEKKNKHTEEVAKTVTTNSGKKKNKHTEEVAKTVTTNSGKKKNKHTE